MFSLIGILIGLWLLWRLIKYLFPAGAYEALNVLDEAEAAAKAKLEKDGESRVKAFFARLLERR